MAQTRKIWGDIISSFSDEEDAEDPIKVELAKLDAMKKAPFIFLPNETLDEAKERRRKEIETQEKKIDEMINIRQQKEIFKQLQ